VQTKRLGRAGDGLRGGGAPVFGSGTTGEGDDRWVPLVSHSGRRRGKRLAELGRAGWLAGPQARCWAARRCWPVAGGLHGELLRGPAKRLRAGCAAGWGAGLRRPVGWMGERVGVRNRV
jgi:hypothetical protein